MCSLTYLGRDVLKLPFIKTTSLGHEVCIIGGVTVCLSIQAMATGRKASTTFMADYAFKEDEGPEAAKDYALWLATR